MNEQIHICLVLTMSICCSIILKEIEGLEDVSQDMDGF